MKKHSLLFLFFPFMIHAQSILWQNTIGGNQLDALLSIDTTSDGGFVLGGYSWSDASGDKTEDSFGANDYWVVKIDEFGAIQWQTTLGGSDQDSMTKIIQTDDGGYLCGGWSRSPISGNKTDDTNGIEDFWIIRLDNSGNIMWQNSIGSSSDDYLWSIEQTQDGGYILGGFSFSDAGGDKSEDSHGGKDYWIVKVNSLGEVQWENTIGGNDFDSLISIQQTIDGGYIMGGDSRSAISGDKTENPVGENDIWIVKTDSNGIIEWQNTIGGVDEDDLRYIRQTSDNGYILGGNSRSDISGDKTENSQGGRDYWIIKLDSVGDIQWQNTIGGNDSDHLELIRELPSGGYIAGGFSASGISGDKTEPLQGEADYWLVWLNPLGNLVGQKTIGGSDGDILQAMVFGGNQQVVVGGRSASPISGDKDEDVMGMSDYWVVSLDGILDVNSFEDDSIGISPNPSSNWIEITARIPIDTITFFTMDGKKMKEIISLTNTEKIDISGWPEGIYLCRIETPYGVFSKKLVKSSY